MKVKNRQGSHEITMSDMCFFTVLFGLASILTYPIFDLARSMIGGTLGVFFGAVFVFFLIIVVPFLWDALDDDNEEEVK